MEASEDYPEFLAMWMSEGNPLDIRKVDTLEDMNKIAQGAQEHGICYNFIEDAGIIFSFHVRL
jgi:peptidyl-tRNA hydrolase